MDAEKLCAEEEERSGRIFCGILSLFFLFLPLCVRADLDGVYGQTAQMYLVFQFGSSIICILGLLVLCITLSPRYLDIYTVFGALFISLGLLNLYLLAILHFFKFILYLPSIVTILVGVLLFAYSMHKRMKIRELKEQLDRGVITLEEYEQKKKKLFEKSEK